MQRLDATHDQITERKHSLPQLTLRLFSPCKIGSTESPFLRDTELKADQIVIGEAENLIDDLACYLERGTARLVSWGITFQAMTRKLLSHRFCPARLVWRIPPSATPGRSLAGCNRSPSLCIPMSRSFVRGPLQPGKVWLRTRGKFAKTHARHRTDRRRNPNSRNHSEKCDCNQAAGIGGEIARLPIPAPRA